MKRRQLFEFTDLAWWPACFRCLLTDFLSKAIELAKPLNPRLSAVAKAIHRSPRRQIIDLCSGSGGPWHSVIKDLADSGTDDIKVLLTDKFPDETAANRYQGNTQIQYCPEPVDAAQVPAALTGVRTLINGFHHFSPEQATAILRDAIANDQPIVVFELLQRTWRDFLLALLLPLQVVLFTPFIRPFRWRRLFLTYIIPVAPLVITWDALVSVLRCYTPDELQVMIRQAGGEGYEWDVGTYRFRGSPVTYLIGWPAIERAERAAQTGP